MRHKLTSKSNNASQTTNILLFVCYVFVIFINSAAAKNGKEIFENNCRVCHGEYLHGDMPGVPDLFIQRAWSKKPDSEIHKFVKDGTEASGKSIVMPSKGGNPNLTDEEIESAVQHMREILEQKSLQPDKPYSESRSKTSGEL